MRAVFIDEWHSAPQVGDRPHPEAQAGQALVRVEACGVGLTLESARAGEMGGTVPRVLGHEFSGTIAELGAGAENWHLGDRVTGSFYLVCGQCEMCASGRETLCRRFAGFIGTAIDGALAEYLVVPAANLVRIPDGVEMVEAGVVADAVATTYHAARERARLAPDERAAIIGAGGGLGVHMVEMARAFGAKTFAIETDQRKLDQLRQAGRADVVIDASREGWEQELIDSSDGRLDACFDFVCATETMKSATGCLGPGGRLVLAGFRAGVLPVVPPPVILKELTVTGSRYATRAEIAKTLELVARGAVKTVIGKTWPIEETPRAFEAIMGNEVFGRIVIDVALGAASTQPQPA